MSGNLLVGGTGGGDQDLGPCRDEREVAGRKVLLARNVPVLENLGRHLAAQVHREPATRRETATRRRVEYVRRLDLDGEQHGVRLVGDARDRRQQSPGNRVRWEESREGNEVVRQCS